MSGTRADSLVVPAARVAAWCLLTIIVFLTLSPASLRPVTPVPHALEHAAIFFLAGLAFGVGYEAQTRALAIGAIAFSTALELAQLMVPGRHARLNDFFVDAVAALAGVLIGAASSHAQWKSRQYEKQPSGQSG